MLNYLRDAFIVGLFVGFLISMMALCFVKPATACEVNIGNGHETHTYIGVVVKGEE